MRSRYRSLQEEESTETEFPMHFRNKEGKKRRRDRGKWATTQEEGHNLSVTHNLTLDKSNTG